MGHKSVCHYGMPITGSWPFLAWSLPQAISLATHETNLSSELKPNFSKSWSKNQEIKNKKQTNQWFDDVAGRLLKASMPFFSWTSNGAARAPLTGTGAGARGAARGARAGTDMEFPEIRDSDRLFVFGSGIPNWSCFFFQLLKLQLWQSIIQLAKPLLAALEDWEWRKIQMALQC